MMPATINNNLKVIALDMGTSSMRACVIDKDLTILYQHSVSVPLDSGMDGQAEQNAEVIYSAVEDCLKSVSQWAESRNLQLSGLCFSSAVGSLVILDQDDQPILPALTWADTRAADEADNLKANLGGELYGRTACPMHPSYWLPKFQWLKNRGFEIKQSYRFCTLKDLVVLRLTGKFLTDSSNAAATGMRNTSSEDWDQLSLQLAGIIASKLPVIGKTTEIVPLAQNDYVLRTGLSKYVPIILGATDGVLSSLGAGSFKPGQVSTMVGTSGACRIAATEPDLRDPQRRLWSYPLTDQIWIRGGAMTNGGLVTQWFTENFYGKDPEAILAMFSEATTIPTGAEGLIFLPYLLGERAPIYNAHARGVFFGLHGKHTRAHMARAALEGIYFGLLSIYEVVSASVDKVSEVRTTGGHLRSPLSLQIMADIFNCPINVPENFEGSAIGAAGLGFYALGAFHDFSPVRNSVRIQRVIEPDSRNTAVYAESYAQFKQLYKQLIPIFNQEKR